MLEFVANRKVFLGENSISKLPEILIEKNIKKVFVSVFNRNVDFVKEALELLVKNNIEFYIYDKIVSEPNLEVIDNGVKICKEEGCEAVIAIGGGSVLDASKAISMIVINGGEVEDYQLRGKVVTKTPLFFIAIPTTSGTGAEATKVSVVYNDKKGWKKALYDNSMIASVVILDPKATVGLSKKITAFTGMDAITHAIESYISKNANEISKMYSLKALKLLVNNIETACNEPNNIQARENMLLGSYLAGYAISVGTCLAHIIGQPVGAVYHISHGEACSIFLAPTMKVNKNYALDLYYDIAKVLDIETYNKTKEEVVDEAIKFIENLCERIGAPTKLSSFISKEKFDMELVLDNIEGSMGHIKTNPLPVSRELFKEVIEMTF